MNDHQPEGQGPASLDASTAAAPAAAEATTVLPTVEQQTAWTEPGMAAPPNNGLLRAIQELLQPFETRLAGVESALAEMTGQVSLIPRQVRQLSSKVEGVEASIAEPRCRAMLLGLLGVYDLVEPLVRAERAPLAEADHRRNYQVLHTQLRQLLETNGLTEIRADGEFDPRVHRAVERIPCSAPEGNNQVLRVVRPGFRTEQAILRFAEVVVGHYDLPRCEHSPAGAGLPGDRS